MKKLFAVAVALILGPLAPAFAATNLDPNQCSAVSVGTSASSPTQIFAQDPAATATWVMNISTNAIFFVGGSTTSFAGLATNATLSTNATTGSFKLPGVAANVQPILWTLDGVNNPYTGPLWATAGSDGASMTILRCRTH